MRRSIAIAALVLLSAVAAHAQLASVYVTYSPTHLSNVPSGTAPNGQTQYTSFWASDIGGGVTVNFLPLPLITLGWDLRGSTRSGTNGMDTVLGGIRLGIHPHVIRAKPYIQASTGYLGTRTFNQSSPPGPSPYTNHYFAYEILGGIDYPLTHFIDVRMIEIGGGKVISTGPNTPGLFTLNSGLVVHF